MLESLWLLVVGVVVANVVVLVGIGEWVNGKGGSCGCWVVRAVVMIRGGAEGWRCGCVEDLFLLASSPVIAVVIMYAGPGASRLGLLSTSPAS